MTRTCIIDSADGTVVNVVDMGMQPDTPNVTEYVAPPAGFLFVADDTAQIGWNYNAGVFTAPPPPTPPPPTPDQVLAEKIAAGIAITSTGTPAISATYALDLITMNQIGQVAQDSFNLGLPGGLSTFTYPDINGTPHVFSAPNIQNLYKAQRDLLLVLNTQFAILAAGGTPTWPAQTKTIA